MALPFENASDSARRDARDRHHRVIASLSRSSPTQAFLADTASQALDVSIRLEEVILQLASVTVNPAEAERAATTAQLASALATLRSLHPATAAIFGRTAAACKYDCTAVAEAVALDDDLPGLSSAQLRNIRSTYSQSQAAASAARSRSSASSSQFRRLQYQLSAATATLQGSGPSPPASGATSAPSSSTPSAPRRSAQLDTNPRNIYPCRSCNVLGHWREDNMCRPEDVRANIQRLAALLNPGQLALPAPGQGTSGMTNSIILGASPA